MKKILVFTSLSLSAISLFFILLFIFLNTSPGKTEFSSSKTVLSGKNPENKKTEEKTQTEDEKKSVVDEDKPDASEKDLDYERLETVSSKSFIVQTKMEIERIFEKELSDKVTPISYDILKKMADMGLKVPPSTRFSSVLSEIGEALPRIKLKGENGPPKACKVIKLEKDKITVERYNLPPGKRVKTYKLEELDEECLYFFKDDLWEKKYNEELSKLYPDFEKRKKLCDEIKPKIEEEIYTSRGFAYSKKTKQWVPKKRGEIKYTLTKDTETYRVVTGEAVPNDILTSMLIDAYSEGNEVIIRGSDKIKNDKLGDKDYLTVKVYRSKEKDGIYRLIFDDKIKLRRIWKDFRFGLGLKDKNALSEKKNSVYYCLDIYDGNTLLYAFEPMEVKLIPKPVISKGKWSYQPFFEEKEDAGTYIIEKVTNTPVNTYFARLGSTKLEHEFSKFEKYPLKLVIACKAQRWWYPNGNTDCMRSNEYVLSEGKEKIENYIIPDFFNDEPHLRFRLNKPMEVEITDFKINGKKYPCFQKNNVIFRTPRGIITTVSMLIKKSSVDKTPVSATLKFKMPLTPPLIDLKTGLNGIEMKWPKINEKELNEDFVYPPKLVIQGFDKIMPNLKDTSFLLKKGIWGSKYEYKMIFANSVFKTQAWIDKIGVIDVYLQLDSIVNYSIPSTYAIFLVKDENYEKFKGLRKGKEKEDEKIIPYVLGPRPVKIGLRSEMLHDKSGILDLRFSSDIINRLMKEKNFELYDRNKRDTKSRREIILGKGQQVKPSPQVPVDFIISLNDFSREDGNGVEVWLIKNTPSGGSSGGNNYSYIYRTGTLYWGDKVEKRSKIISDLISKIKEMTDFQASEAEFTNKCPENIVFSRMSPVEQRAELIQAPYTGESIMLSLSAKLKDRSILSFDEWSLIFQEQMMMEAQGVNPEKRYGDDDVLVSSYAYNGNKGIEFFFFISDIKTSRILAANQFMSSGRAFISELAKWISAIKTAKKSIEVPESLEYSCNANEMKVKIYDYARTYTFSSYSQGGGSNVLELAKIEWNAGNRDFAINILQESWNRNKNFGTGEMLAKYLHETGLYSMELALLQQLSEMRPGHSGIIRDITRVQSLVKNAGRNYSKTPKKEVKNEKISFKTEVNTRSLRTTVNTSVERLFPIARRTYAMDWLSGGTASRILYCRAIPKDLAQLYADAALNKYGIVCEIKEINLGKLKTNQWDFSTAEKVFASVFAWEAYQVFDSPISDELNKGVYLVDNLRLNLDGYLFPNQNLKFQNSLLDFTPVSLIKILFDLKERPNMRVKIPMRTETMTFTGKDILRFVSGNVFNRKKTKDILMDLKLEDYIAIDMLAALGDAKAASFISSVVKYPAVDEYKKKDKKDNRVGLESIFFQAYKGKGDAVLFLSDRKNYYFRMSEDKKEFIFLMSKAGREEILRSFLRDEDIIFIRWGKKETVSSLLSKYPDEFDRKSYYFLTMGFHDDAAVKNIFYSGSRYGEFDRISFLERYYGKPYWEIYEDYMKEFKE